MRSYDTCIHAVVLTSLPPQPGCNKVPYGKFDTKPICPLFDDGKEVKE